MQRRDFLRSAGAVAAMLSSGVPLARDDPALGTHGPPAAPGAIGAPSTAFAAAPPLAPIRASVDRIIAIDVCTRPFRAQGPRIEAERIGRRTVIHNYGHGGAGWSLSWGSAALAVALARDTDEKKIAVVGCGAIGLTTALVAQRAGLRVRIHAKARLPDVPSSGATGVWSPDSRLCTAAHATPEFERRWQTMARTSFRTYQTLLGLADTPVEWRDGYALRDAPPGPPGPPAYRGPGGDNEPEYAHLESKLLADLGPRSQVVEPGMHPFHVAHVRRYTQLVFNLGAYSRLLMEEFLDAGGEIETREFASVREFADIREKTIVNATGYGARALLGDDSLIPVRGQTAKLIPQPEVTYGLSWIGHNLVTVARRDGILVQEQAPGDFGNADTTPDRPASEAAVMRLATLFV